MRRNKSEALLEDLSELPGAVFEADKDSDRLLSIQSPNSVSNSNLSRQAAPAGTFRRDEEEESDSSPSFTLEQGIEEIGIGKLQWRLLFICGGWWGCDAIEIMLLSFLLPLLVKEWDLSPFSSAVVASATFFGAFVGTFLWGPISDKYGRRIGYLATTVFTSVFGLASAFAPNLPALIILRALLGVGIGGTPVAFSMFSEFLPVKNRGRILVAFEVLWTVGILFEACLAWILVPRVGWRWLIAISSVPLWLMLLCYPLVPESPRFLMISGRRREAEEVLDRVAKINGKVLPPGRLAVSEVKEERGKFLDLVRIPSLRVLSILLWGIWFVNSIAYYGNVLFTPEYFEKTLPPEDSGSIYFLTIITTIAEFPGLAVSALLIDRVGRTRTMGLMLLGCAICTVFLLLQPSVAVGVLLLSGGRMFIEASYAALWTYTPEAYPTTIRATGLGVSNAWSKIASIITPFISASILSVSVTVPVLIFSGFAVLGSVLAFMLPFDTKGRAMMDNVASPDLNLEESQKELLETGHPEVELEAEPET
eukprot:TRINITY_DN10004_c0_g1_i1.p1 TRINITY_DN10004_c0_g1~~TRINITY_DN10004_c0_g1_i1.p1  ORF type:complete len:536 (+),score=52.26 TRINITY_DN10004_c0_g1_i1:37-1644(+)